MHEPVEIILCTVSAPSHFQVHPHILVLLLGGDDSLPAFALELFAHFLDAFSSSGRFLSGSFSSTRSLMDTNFNNAKK
jgi:hypothetical protein